MDSLVEGSLEWTPLVEDDLVELGELRQAIEYFDDPLERFTLEDLYDQFQEPEGDPSANGVVGRDKGGTIVAYGWNRIRGIETSEPRAWLDGGVHPAWRHKQIGRRLLEWQIERALEWYAEVLVEDPTITRPLWLGIHVDQKSVAVKNLVARSGFAPYRWYFDMHAPFFDEAGEPVPMGVFPDLGRVQLCPFHPALSEQVRAAHNEAFSTTPGTHVVSRATWEHTLARSAARPEWSWVAMEDGEVVGYAMNSVYVADWEPQGFSEGWTDRIGVRPGWRARGIGPALLQASMRSFRDAGLQGAGLGVDTEHPDGAAVHFEKVGYVRDDMVVLHVREFPPEAVTG